MISKYAPRLSHSETQISLIRLKWRGSESFITEPNLEQNLKHACAASGLQAAKRSSSRLSGASSTWRPRSWRP